MPDNPTLANVHGTYGTDINQDRQQRQVNNNLVRVYPDVTKFLTLLSSTATVSDGHANKYEWQFLGEFPRTAEITAGAAANATALTVASNTHINIGQILQDMETGEQLLVLAKPDAVTLTVGTRGAFGGGAPQGLVAGQQLLLLGTALEEGQAALAPIGMTPAMDYNWFQQFERTYGITDRAKAILYYGPNQDDLDDMEALNEYKKQRERSFLFGYRKQKEIGESGATTHRRWLCGGMKDFVESWDGGNNVFDAGGAFTFQELGKFMLECTRIGASADKIGLCSRQVLSIMSAWQLGNHQMDASKTKQFGLDFNRFFGPGWNLYLMHSEQFETEGLHNQLYIIDRKYVRQHIMRGMGDTVNREITGPAKDGNHTYRHQITGTHTLEVNLGGAHGIVRGIES